MGYQISKVKSNSKWSYSNLQHELYHLILYPIIYQKQIICAFENIRVRVNDYFILH